MKRLGLLVIGDEILAGHTQDTNSHWLAKRLNQNGIALRRIETCTDELDDIVASVKRFLTELPLDYVVTSGGLGPTHDDRTMEGIAKAIGVDLELTDENRRWMVEHVRRGHEYGYFRSAEPNEGHMKMALLPAGSAPLPNGLGTCLGAKVGLNGRLLFTLPGVPGEFERMFDESVLPELEGTDPPFVEEQILYTEESRFFGFLRDLEKDHPGIAVGSYPHRGYILIRATGDKAQARKAMAKLREAGAEYLEPRPRS